MKVTLKKLKTLNACKDGIEWFRSYKGDKELIPLLETLIKVNVDWANWLITHYMTKEQCKKYITNPKIYNNAYANAYTHAHAYAYSNAYTHAYTHAYAYANAYTHAYAHAYAHAYTHAYASAYAEKLTEKLTEIVKWGIEILGGAE